LRCKTSTELTRLSSTPQLIINNESKKIQTKQNNDIKRKNNTLQENKTGIYLYDYNIQKYKINNL
jgi:hypothetical protein